MALKRLLRQCGAKAIVFDAAFTDVLPDATEAPGLSLRICVDGAGHDALADLGRGITPLTAPAAVQEAGPAALLYTPDPTGHTNGAMRGHFTPAPSTHPSRPPAGSHLPHRRHFTMVFRAVALAP